MNYASMGVAIALLAGAGALVQQKPSPTSSAKNSVSAGSAVRGKTIFGEKCAVCHNANSGERKVGPGLKGISKRTAFSVNGKKITDESLKEWIENGDDSMPPFKDALASDQIRDVVAYVKTL